MNSQNSHGISRRQRVLLALWGGAVVLMGCIFTSLHQPFRPPDNGVLSLVSDPGRGEWRMVHVLSGSCGCSQVVMEHLLKRGAIPGVKEQVLVVDSGEQYLPGSRALLLRLDQEGFRVTHIDAQAIPKETGLRGVPLLILASPENKISYMGGYGSHGNQDDEILEQVKSGQSADVLPVLGCAVTKRLRRKVDYFAFNN